MHYTKPNAFDDSIVIRQTCVFFTSLFKNRICESKLFKC